MTLQGWLEFVLNRAAATAGGNATIQMTFNSALNHAMKLAKPHARHYRIRARLILGRSFRDDLASASASSGELNDRFAGAPSIHTDHGVAVTSPSNSIMASVAVTVNVCPS